MFKKLWANFVFLASYIIIQIIVIMVCIGLAALLGGCARKETIRKETIIIWRDNFNAKSDLERMQFEKMIEAEFEKKDTNAN